MISHAEFLRKVTLDDALVAALREDWRTAPVSNAERHMIEYVVQLTEDATRISPAYHDRLRTAGHADSPIRTW